MARVWESGGRGAGVRLAFAVGWSGGSLPGERRGLGKGVERTAWEEQEQEQEPDRLTGIGEGLSDAIRAVRSERLDRAR